MNTEWLLLCDYYPDIEFSRQHIQQYSKKLAQQFVAKGVLQSKQMEQHANIARSLIDEFLERKYGEDLELNKLGEALLLSRFTKAADELEHLIRILGKQAKVEKIYPTLKKKYPEISNVAYRPVKPRSAKFKSGSSSTRITTLIDKTVTGNSTRDELRELAKLLNCNIKQKSVGLFGPSFYELKSKYGSYKCFDLKQIENTLIRVYKAEF